MQQINAVAVGGPQGGPVPLGLQHQQQRQQLLQQQQQQQFAMQQHQIMMQQQVGCVMHVSCCTKPFDMSLVSQ